MSISLLLLSLLKLYNRDLLLAICFSNRSLRPLNTIPALDVLIELFPSVLHYLFLIGNMKVGVSFELFESFECLLNSFND